MNLDTIMDNLSKIKDMKLIKNKYYTDSADYIILKYLGKNVNGEHDFFCFQEIGYITLVDISGLKEIKNHRKILKDLLNEIREEISNLRLVETSITDELTGI